MVPVLPVTVTSTVLPRLGFDVETVTVVTVLLLELIVSETVTENACDWSYSLWEVPNRALP